MRTAEETRAYYATKKTEWLEEAKRQADAPITNGARLFGQVSEQRGSWTLICDPADMKEIRLSGSYVMAFLCPTQIDEIWALPHGLWACKMIVDNGTHGVRFYVERSRAS